MMLAFINLKTSIAIMLSFITLWITLASCESYCDVKVGICINTNKVHAQSWDYSAEECIKDGSILLEIYDENYKEVIITAIQKFALEGYWLLFGLEYYNGQFHWRSKHEVKVQLKGMDGFQSNTNCNFFLILNGSQLLTSIGDCSSTPNNYFLCSKDKYYQPTITSKIPQIIPTNITTPNIFSTISNNNNNNRSPDDNYDQLNEIQKKNIGIGVGVTISLILIIVVVVVLGIYFFKKRRRRNSSADNTQIVEEAAQAKSNSHQYSTPTSESNLVYADLQLQDKNNDHKTDDDDSKEIYHNSHVSYYPDVDLNSINKESESNDSDP